MQNASTVNVSVIKDICWLNHTINFEGPGCSVKLTLEELTLSISIACIGLRAGKKMISSGMYSFGLRSILDCLWALSYMTLKDSVKYPIVPLMENEIGLFQMIV